MDKKKALERLSSLEKEAQELRKIIESSEDVFNADTYEKVCKALNEEELTELTFRHFHKEDKNKQLAFAKIKQLERYFNQGWKLDKYNNNQQKWYIYFNIVSGGLVVDDSDYFSFFLGLVGDYKDKKTADFVGKNFKDIYEDLL